MPRQVSYFTGGSSSVVWLHECGDVSAVSLSVLGELSGVVRLPGGLADAIWICSGAVPERAASMIVLAGVVTRMPWRGSDVAVWYRRVAVCRVTRSGAGLPGAHGDEEDATVFGRTSESPCSTSALSCEITASPLPGWSFHDGDRPKNEA